MEHSTILSGSGGVSHRYKYRFWGGIEVRKAEEESGPGIYGVVRSVIGEFPEKQTTE
jgi:hypothetical protein